MEGLTPAQKKSFRCRKDVCFRKAHDFGRLFDLTNIALVIERNGVYYIYRSSEEFCQGFFDSIPKTQWAQNSLPIDFKTVREATEEYSRQNSVMEEDDTHSYVPFLSHQGDAAWNAGRSRQNSTERTDSYPLSSYMLSENHEQSPVSQYARSVLGTQDANRSEKLRAKIRSLSKSPCGVEKRRTISTYR